MLLLACRWVWVDRGSGGLSDANARTAALYLVEALCQLLCTEGNEFHIRLDISKDWVNSWPRPSFFAHPVFLIVEPGAVTDFSQWDRLADDHGAGPFCVKARARVVEATAAAHSPRVGFLALCLEATLQSLFQQVITRFGAELQRRALQ